MICVQTPRETALLSMGKTRYGLYQNLARVAWLAVAAPLGWKLAGLRGLIWGVALSETPIFFVTWPVLRRAGMLRWSREGLALLLYGAGWALASAARAWLR
jgi:hypothetical protein